MKGFLELGILGILGVANSPFPDPNPIDVIPSLNWRLEIASPLFVGGDISSRCKPVELNRFNPQTALWTVETGLRIEGLTIALGHTSEHGVDKRVAATESRDYLFGSYRVEF